MVVLLLPLVAAILLLNHFHPLQTLPEGEQTLGFIIESAPKPTAKCERFETRLIPHGKVYLYLLRDSTKTLPTYGDTIVARTDISWFQTTGRAFSAHYLILPAKRHRTPLQTRLYQRLEAGGLSGNELATVGALTLGYKDDLDKDLKRHFQASGAAHVLAVSGLHTGIIYGLLLALFTLGGRYRPLYEQYLSRCLLSLTVIACMWGYAWLTGMTPSVVRAVTMVTLFEVGRMAYRPSISLNSIAAAAVLILLIHPSDLWNVSFQLSFAATASIVLLVNAFQWKLHAYYGWWTIPANYIIGILIVSLAAQLGTLPITIYNFGQVSTYFLLTNLIILPLAAVLVPAGLLSIALGGSVLGIWFSHLTFGLSWLMNHSVGWIESLPGITVPAHVNGWMIFIYYVLLLLFFAFMPKKYE